jgi:hypothetical protein
MPRTIRDHVSETTPTPPAPRELLSDAMWLALAGLAIVGLLWWGAS